MFTGPGGVRFADFVLQIGQKFVAIEAKTNMPMAGSALVRFAGQLRTYIVGAPTNPALAGSAIETVVITEQSAIAVEAAFVAIEKQVATGTLAGVLQGTNGLVTALRGVLLGF